MKEYLRILGEIDELLTTKQVEKLIEEAKDILENKKEADLYASFSEENPAEEVDKNNFKTL